VWSKFFDVSEEFGALFTRMERVTEAVRSFERSTNFCQTTWRQISFAFMFVKYYKFEFGLRQSYTYAVSNITPHEETFVTSAEDRGKWPVRRPGCYTPWKENPDSLFCKTQRGDDNSIIASDTNHSPISQS